MDYTGMPKDKLEEQEALKVAEAAEVGRRYTEDKDVIELEIEECKRRISQRTAIYQRARDPLNTELRLIRAELKKWEEKTPLAFSPETPEPQTGTPATRQESPGGDSTISGVAFGHGSLVVGVGPGPTVSTINLRHVEPNTRKRSAPVVSDSGPLNSPWSIEKGTGLSSPSPEEPKTRNEIPPPKRSPHTVSS